MLSFKLGQSTNVVLPNTWSGKHAVYTVKKQSNYICSY